MASNTLNNRSAGQTILDTFFNDIHTALDGDFVGRNSSGVPEAAQNLGTAAIPWGTVRANALILNGAAVDTSQIVSPVNRVISGKKRSTSNQPAFLVPNGAAASFILDGTPTNLLVDINGTPVTIATDITKSSLTTAPSSNNTCLVNDSEAAGQADTRLWGAPEHRKAITVDTMGSAITGKVGKFCAFKLAGGATEYFLAYVESTTKLSHIRRGYFYDSALSPVNRTTLSDNDVITIMSLGWVFVDVDTTTVDVSYTNPTWSFTSPSSPTTGDYWYDLANKMWKRYDGASFVIINRTFIGNVVIDSTNCVSARCVDFYANYSDENTFSFDVSTTEIILSKKQNASVNVAGQLLKFLYSLTSWNITTDLATSADMYNATEQSSTMYYLYLKDDGKNVMSDISPYYRGDLLGAYHPHNPWRCVGLAYNNGSSNLVVASSIDRPDTEVVYTNVTAHGATRTKNLVFSTVWREKGAGVIRLSDSNNGDYYTIFIPGKYKVWVTLGTSIPNDEHGASLNATSLTDGIGSVPVAQVLILTGDDVAGNVHTGVWEGQLKIGDVVRPHDQDASAGSNDQFSRVGVCQVTADLY